MRRGFWVLPVAALLAALAHGEPAGVALSGHVLAASGKHAVHVALWRSDGFLEHPAQQVAFAPGVTPAFRFEVAPGPWAISAFEDRNDNGILDMGLFGPKEPIGFWRPFTARRKPKFRDVVVLVSHDIANADITLR